MHNNKENLYYERKKLISMFKDQPGDPQFRKALDRINHKLNSRNRKLKKYMTVTMGLNLMKTYQKYTEEDIRFIIDNYRFLPYYLIGEMIDRTGDAIRAQCRMRGLT